MTKLYDVAQAFQLDEVQYAPRGQARGDQRTLIQLEPDDTDTVYRLRTGMIVPAPDLADFDQRRALVQALEAPVDGTRVAAEGLRWTNHKLGRLAAATDVYELAGEELECLARLPQALQGMRDWLERNLAGLRTVKAAEPGTWPEGDDVTQRIMAARADLGRVAEEIEDTLLPTLRRAQGFLSPVYGPVKPGDEAATC